MNRVSSARLAIVVALGGLGVPGCGSSGRALQAKLPESGGLAHRSEDVAPLVTCGMSRIPARGEDCAPAGTAASLIWVNVHEVTVREYDECVRAGVCERFVSTRFGDSRDTPGAVSEHCNAGFRDRADHAMNCITWTMADRFCRWSGKRLPSVLEWKYAVCDCVARVPDAAAPQPRDDHEAGNVWGLAGIVGNVSEWTSSIYCSDKFLDEGPHCAGRTIVGGSTLQPVAEERLCQDLTWAKEDVRLAQVGFRCASDTLICR
jgi:hypothetical protein